MNTARRIDAKLATNSLLGIWGVLTFSMSFGCGYMNTSMNKSLNKAAPIYISGSDLLLGETLVADTSKIRFKRSEPNRVMSVAADFIGDELEASYSAEAGGLMATDICARRILDSEGMPVYGDILSLPGLNGFLV